MNTISESASPWRATTELAIAPSARPEAGSPRPADLDDDGFELWGDDGFTFLDFLDIINPLHHIPVIGTLYRQFSGDELDAGSRVLGGTLFFGPVGTVASIANVLIEEGTGRDVGEHVIAFFQDQEPGPPRVSESAGEAVADIGVRSAPLPDLPNGPASGPAPGPATGVARQGPVDPVTAWAMAEVAYRKSAADKARWAPVGDAADGPARASTTAATDPVSAWAARTAAETPTAAIAARTDAAAGAIRDTRAGAILFQAAAGLDRPHAGTGTAGGPNGTWNDTRNDTRNDTGAAPGAIGRNGGWFTETMLTALEKYDDGAALGGAAQTGAARAGTPAGAGLDVIR